MRTFARCAAGVLLFGALCGCRTSSGTIVYKSEAELDAMEMQDAEAARLFAAGKYEDAERLLLRLAEEETVSRPLYDLERVSVLLMQGRHAEAHELMTALRREFDVMFDERSEAEATSLWHGENRKLFKADVHELATFYALLAMSYVQRDEWDEAERCVKNGLLADSANTDDARYNSDYALLHYLGYLVCRKTGRDEDAKGYLADMRLSMGACAPIADELVRKTPMPNAFLVLWCGNPPSFVRGGEYSQIRHVVPGSRNCVSSALVSIDRGRRSWATGGWADVNFQARTRGGREMDSVLADKAAVKTGFRASGNVMFAIGMALLANDQTYVKCIGGGCLLAGLVSHVAGACVNPTADVRHWKNLPGQFLVVPVCLSPGDHRADIDAFILRDKAMQKAVSMNIPQDRFSIFHVSLMDDPDRTYPCDGPFLRALELSKGALTTPISSDMPAEIARSPIVEAK